MNKSMLATSSIEATANRYSAWAVLNCYVREIAIPHRLLDFLPDSSADTVVGVLHVRLPYLGKKLSVTVANQSLVGNYIYTSGLSIKNSQGDVTFSSLAWENLAALVIEELCLRYQNHAVKTELLAQIENSAALIKQSVAQGRHLDSEKGFQVAGGDYAGYIASESALIFGHSFHPAPKCRQGFGEAESVLYGPEFGRAFQLHYFALSPEASWIATTCAVPMQLLMEDMAQLSAQDIPEGWSLLPCHPWQADYLRQQLPVQQAIDNNVLKYLGASGIYFRPTASVRTLYNENFPYFLKCSLSMRITNSVRKNAYYELEASVRLTRILEPVIKKMEQQFPGFEFALEPFALSANVPGVENESQADLRSHFGVIFRDATPFQQSKTIQYLLSATLFADDHQGTAWLEKCLLSIGAVKHTHQGCRLAMDWFACYLKHLVDPLLFAYFDQGVACEPHLQNVVIKLNNGWPSGVILRDLEGTKLIKGVWDEAMLAGLGDKALASVLHDEDKTWQRISYCLFINHVAQAIYQLCRFGVNEQLLWAMVRESVKQFVVSRKADLVTQRLGGLLSGTPFMTKANLITRFFQHADSNASYVQLPNPLSLPVSERVEYV